MAADQPPVPKSTISELETKLREGAIKPGTPEFDEALGKIDTYVQWQGTKGIKRRTTTNTKAVNNLLREFRSVKARTDRFPVRYKNCRRIYAKSDEQRELIRKRLHEAYGENCAY